jgi:hypothetical protein
MIVDGINFDLVQTESKVNNPVDNPPYNNWSVNQPSPPHMVGWKGNEDWGQNMIVDGHRVKFAQTSQPNNLAQLAPFKPGQNIPGNFLVEERNPSHDPTELVQQNDN